MTDELPCNQACYECNPPLWARFVVSYRKRFGVGPNPNPFFTEAFCTQWLDTETVTENG